MKLKRTRTVLPALVTLLVASLAHAQQYYTMNLLGFAPFSVSSLSVNGINNNGDVHSDEI